MDGACWVFSLPAFTRLTWMSGSFESVRWNASVQTRFRFILSSESFWGIESEPIFTLREKSPQRRIEPTTLHQAGQRAQHTTNWASPAPLQASKLVQGFSISLQHNTGGLLMIWHPLAAGLNQPIRARMHHKVVGNFGSEADVRSLYYRRFRFNETFDVGPCTHGRPAK